MSGSDDDAGEFTLLATKGNWLGLLDRLRCGKGHKPMMISPLPDSGQSTLLCYWLDSCPRPQRLALAGRGRQQLGRLREPPDRHYPYSLPDASARRSASSRRHPIRRWRQDHASRELVHPPGLPVNIRHHSDPLFRYATPGEFRAQKMINLLLHHDDSEREYTYTHNAERALQVAQERGWTVVSMKTGF